MRDPLLDKSSTPRSRPHQQESRPGKIDPVELGRWLRQHRERLGDRWLAGVESRHEGLGDPARDLLSEFIRLLTRFPPVFLSPYRSHVEPLWAQLSELYGSVAAMRGLAAGEVIEEFQLLREEILRLFHDVPPVRELDRLALRDVLLINRIVDLGVTHASVGHTDALFFALFQGSGVANHLTAEQETEVREQLRAIDSELEDVTERLEG
ncbi:MAG: hypothetical protein ACLFWG_00830 [Longimicrobiales bacterium]